MLQIKTVVFSLGAPKDNADYVLNPFLHGIATHLSCSGNEPPFEFVCPLHQALSIE